MTINHNYTLIFLTKSDFSHSNLNNKVKHNDIIFHFAGVNRDINDSIVFDKNETINNTLLKVLKKSILQENFFLHHQFRKTQILIMVKQKMQELNF